MCLSTQEKKDTFWRDGVLIMENAISEEQLEAVRNEFVRWVEESRA